MRADADPNTQDWREEEKQDEQPGDFGSIDDPSDDNDLLVVVFSVRGGGITVEVVDGSCWSVAEGGVVVCW